MPDETQANPTEAAPETGQTAGGAPQPTGGQTEAAPTEQTAGQTAPAEPALLAGKFKSVDELEKAYQEGESSATRMAQENAQLRRALGERPPPDQASGEQPPWQEGPAPAAPAEPAVEEPTSFSRRWLELTMDGNYTEADELLKAREDWVRDTERGEREALDAEFAEASKEFGAQEVQKHRPAMIQVIRDFGVSPSDAYLMIAGRERLAAARKEGETRKAGEVAEQMRGEHLTGQRTGAGPKEANLARAWAGLDSGRVDRNKSIP